MSYTSELQQDYAERRKRLFNPPIKPPQHNNRRPYNPTIWHERKRDVIVVASEPVKPPKFAPIIFPAAPWRDIVKEVCVKHGMTFAEIRGHCRARDIVAARHEVCYRLATETPLSLPAIGRRLGGKDHTTVLHGIRKHRERMAAHLSNQLSPLSTGAGETAE